MSADTIVVCDVTGERCCMCLEKFDDGIEVVEVECVNHILCRDCWVEGVELMGFDVLTRCTEVTGDSEWVVAFKRS